MKLSVFFTFLTVIFLPLSAGAPDIDYNKYFTGKTMRIDYFHVGNSSEELITIDKIYKEGVWAGSKKKLIDPFPYGKYRVKIFSLNKNILLFSRGFDSYFGEYKTTGDAGKGIKKSYHESALIPFPKKEIIFTLERVSNKGENSILIREEIDPSSVNIIREKRKRDITVFNIHNTGNPSERVDLVIVAEGYTKNDREKVKRDLQKVKEIFFSQEPYKTNMNKFNIYGVFKPSDEKGTDEPRIGKFKNTSVDTTFNSLGSARYLLTEANKKLRDITSAAPCDAIMIMVNSSRYGGGGIYNSFCTFTIDNEQASYLILHEFGHSFSGLADEYYSSAVAYNDFYPRGVEPVEPNITALLNPSKIKWSSVVGSGTKIPTPWGKKDFDRMNAEFGKKRKEINSKIERLTKSGASEDVILRAKREIEILMKKNERDNRNFFLKSGMIGTVGAFEGAGYSSKGMYRPMIDCIMFTIGKKPYCKVCENGVSEMIKKYSN